MQLIRQLPTDAPHPTAVAIGNFDGLHRGHQAVIAAMVAAAAERQVVPGVLTFEPHPRRFFMKQVPAFRIERLATKLHRLEKAGVAQVAMPRFNAAFAGVEAQDFLDHVLARQLGAQVVVTGEDFAFGKQRGGDAAMLKAWGAARGVQIITVPGVMVDGVACSSSAARMAIAAGDMAQARKIFGRDYALTGRVVHGDGRGAGMGFATANVALPTNLQLPAHGVYAVRARLGEMTYDAVANFGRRPTVGAALRPSLEVHLFDFSASIYGAVMEVAFVEKIRDEVKFESLAALTAQIARDGEAARKLLAG
ncbi:MAG: bifunctional riboflavin kinase/FAD synthetase [Pseudomonadota bacterium]